MTAKYKPSHGKGPFLKIEKYVNARHRPSLFCKKPSIYKGLRAITKIVVTSHTQKKMEDKKDMTKLIVKIIETHDLINDQLHMIACGDMAVNSILEAVSALENKSDELTKMLDELLLMQAHDGFTPAD